MAEETLNDFFPDLNELENKIGRKTPESLLIWMKEAADSEDGLRSDVLDREDQNSAACDSISDKINNLKQEMVKLSVVLSSENLSFCALCVKNASKWSSSFAFLCLFLCFANATTCLTCYSNRLCLRDCFELQKCQFHRTPRDASPARLFCFSITDAITCLPPHPASLYRLHLLSICTS